MTNIELPRDAEGREIPLGTDALYDKNGERLTIYAFEHMPKLKHSKWRVRFLFDESGVKYYPDDYCLTPTDSWEKLLDDLGNAAKGGDNAECLYMRMEGIEVGTQCHGCRLYETEEDFTECYYLAYGDIADRIRKLRSEGE